MVANMSETMCDYRAEGMRKTLAVWYDSLIRLGESSDIFGAPEFAFWKLLCAELWFKPGKSYRSRAALRQAQSRNELEFVAWSLRESRSPFLDFPFSRDDQGLPSDRWTSIGLERYPWSRAAEAWRIVMILWKPKITVQSPSQVFEDMEAIPGLRGLQNTPERRRRYIQDLLKILEARFLRWSDFVTDNHESEPEAPWRRILTRVQKLLLSAYGPDIMMDAAYDQGMRNTVNRMRYTLVSRRLIWGSKYIGLAPAETAIGDKLCLIEHGRMPFVLRALKNSNSKQLDDMDTEVFNEDTHFEGIPEAGDSELLKAPRYQLIGDCYLQGIMFGEIPSQSIKWERALLR